MNEYVFEAGIDLGPAKIRTIRGDRLFEPRAIIAADMQRCAERNRLCYSGPIVQFAGQCGKVYAVPTLNPLVDHHAY